MNQEQTTKEILTIVQFLKDNMVSKEEFESRLTEAKSEILTHMDSFVVLHQKLDTELAALRGKYDRLSEQIQQVAKHLQINLQ